jgi:hypothetical protein
MTKIGIKSMEKMAKLLHISEKSCTFAPDLFKNDFVFKDY